MASITLAAGESFEHMHKEDSFTILMYGDVELTMEGLTRILKKEDPIYVPPGVSHTIQNVGASDAKVDCLHEIDGSR